MRKLITMLGLVAALLVPGSALAAGPTNTTTETLALTVTYTLTGVPASISYPDQNAGSGGIVFNPAFPVTFGVSSGTTSLTAAGSDFTGPATISKTNRKVYTTAAVGLTGTPGGSVGTPSSMAASQLLGTTSVAGSNGSENVGLGLNVPSGLAPGTYTGSVVFTLS